MSLQFWRVLMYLNTACSAAWMVLYIQFSLTGAGVVSGLFIIMAALCWVASLDDK